MNRFVFLVFIQLPVCLSAQNNLEFIQENIDFSIDPIRFSIHGIYVFSNNTEHEIHQTILFPFSQKADSVEVKRVYNLTYNEDLSFLDTESGIRFKLNILPKDTVILNISYSQKTDRENIYILESTQAWGEPLQQAEYSLTFENRIEIDSISYKPDSMINHTYFYPKKNFTVWTK